jgi:SAM-dependent methyltransferase
MPDDSAWFDMPAATPGAGGLDFAAPVLPDVLRVGEATLRRMAQQRAPAASLVRIVAMQACHELRLRCWRQIRFRSRVREQVRRAYHAMEVWELESVNARQAWANWRTIPRNLAGRVPSGPVRAVDLCCGTGQSTEVLAWYLAPGSQILGLESNPRFLRAARERRYRTHSGEPMRVEFREQSVLEGFRDASGAGIADGSLDLVNSSGAVGCHFAAPDTRLLGQEIARVLRPGGLALIDSGRAGTSEKELRAVFGSIGFTPIHRARSCALDRHPQVCFRKRRF